MADMDSMETNTDINSLSDLKSESLMDFTACGSGVKAWAMDEIGGEENFVDAEDKLTTSDIFSENSESSTSLFVESSAGSSPDEKRLKLHSKESNESVCDRNSEEPGPDPSSETVGPKEDLPVMEGLTERIMKWISGWLQARIPHPQVGSDNVSNEDSKTD